MMRRARLRCCSLAALAQPAARAGSRAPISRTCVPRTCSSRQPRHRGAADRPGARRVPASQPPTASAQTDQRRRLRRATVDEAYGAFQRGYYLTALDLALPRAEKGDAAAQTLIAEIYAKGLGVAAEPRHAPPSWYALASKNGDTLATFELALMYQDGRGVPKNRQRAAELFKPGRRRGQHARPSTISALLHVEGIYVEPSLVKAAALMKEAADAGLPEAQYDYGTHADRRRRRRARPGRRAPSRSASPPRTGLIRGPGRLRDRCSISARACRATARPPSSWYAARRRCRQSRGAEPLRQAARRRRRRRRSTSRMPRCGARWPAGRASTTRSSTSSSSRSRPTNCRRAEERARFWPVRAADRAVGRRNAGSAGTASTAGAAPTPRRP